MPDDEYTVLSSSSSGAIETISAPNRVMIANTVPIAKGTSATFSSNGQLSRAILAEDVTVFGIPLAGGTPVEVNPSLSQVLLGTIGRDTTIEGIPYSNGCLAHLPPTSFDHQVPPCELITSLAFRIKTSDAIMSSAYVPITDKADDIWIDIGPQAWRIAPELNPDSTLGNMKMTGSLGKGKTALVEILNPAIGESGTCSAIGGPDVPLFVGDIRGVRLEKKGIFLPIVCGFAEGPDSVFDLVPNPLAPPNPADVLIDLRRGLKLKNEELEVERKLANDLGDGIDGLQKEIDGFNKTIRELTDKRHEIERLNNDITNKASELVGKACPNADIFCPVIDIGRKCHKAVAAACDVISRVNAEIAQLQQRVISLGGDIAARAAEESFAIQTLPIKLDLQAVKITAKVAVDAKIKLLVFLISIAEPIADDLKKLIDQLIPSIDIPLPGQWKPESITIVVNGRDLASFTIDQRLRQGHSFEEKRIRQMSDSEYFVQGLRVNVNKGDGSFDLPSGVTTPFAKMRGFTGWDIIEGLGKVTVTGVLQHNPSEGADAGVSFDLKISQIGNTSQQNLLDGVRHDRFIRIEYLFGTDQRFRDWHEGDTLRVTGQVKRDRDKTTFYEIHLSSAADISRVRIGP